MEFDFKSIADPVHGTIGLSEIETRVINTQVFQRLRHVAQLGLANYVFPGADYSRLAHSVGVCHVTGKILSILSKHAKTPISEDALQLYRLEAIPKSKTKF